MRTQTTSTSVAGLSLPQLQPYQELTHIPSTLYQQQQLQTFDTKNNPVMHTRKHSLNQGKYHKKMHGKDYGRKRNEYDEKFVSEMSVTEKEIDTITTALTSSLMDEGSFEYDNSAQFEANLSCELTEFEKEILSKYLTEYSDDVNRDDSTDEMDLITKCDEEIAHDDQPVILPTTIAALEISTDQDRKPQENTIVSDECASSSYNSDELMQEEFIVNNDEIQQFAKEYQIGTSHISSSLKSSDNFNFNNDKINNNDFGLSASLESPILTTIISHPHQIPTSNHDHQNKSSLLIMSHITKQNEEDINNNNSSENSCSTDKNNNKNTNMNNSTSTERDNNNPTISSNRLRVILRNNYPIWIGITSCVWGLIIYLMKSYT